MGAKLDGLKLKLDRMKKDDPAVRAFTRITELLSPEHGPHPYTLNDEFVLPPGQNKGQTLELGEEVIRLRGIKTLAAALEESVSQYVKEVELQLHHAMSTVGPVGFSTKSGFKFSMTSQNIVQADKEQGGTGNPHLKQWLVDNGMPDVAAGTINANTFKSSVNKWMEANPIEAVKQVGDDNIILEGAELLEELGVTQEELDGRIAQHASLRSMATITSTPAISVTKA